MLYALMLSNEIVPLPEIEIMANGQSTSTSSISSIITNESSMASDLTTSVTSVKVRFISSSIDNLSVLSINFVTRTFNIRLIVLSFQQ